MSAWFTRAALAAIAGDPGLFVQRLVLRGRALIESFETDVACIPVVEMHLIPPLVLLALPFGVLLGLALGAGLLGGRLAPAPRLPALAVAGMVVLTALLFFHYSRFRLPLVPLLAWWPRPPGRLCARARPASGRRCARRRRWRA